MRGAKRGSRVRVGAGAMLRAGSRLDVLAASDADLRLVWGDSWLGQSEEALSTPELIENGGGKEFSGREKEEIREKEKGRERKKRKRILTCSGFRVLKTRIYSPFSIFQKGFHFAYF